MHHAKHRPMLAAAVLSAALHAAALALVLAQLDQSAQGARQIGVEIAWVQAGRTGNDGGRPTTPASPAGSTRGSIAPPEPWIAGSSPGEDAERRKNQADRDSGPNNAAASLSADSLSSVSPSGLTRGSSQADEPGAVSTTVAGPSDQVRGRQLGVGAEASPKARQSNESGVTSAKPAPTRSRNSNQGLASARSSSEPSPACGRGQGEGVAACTVLSDTSTVQSQPAAQQNEAGGSAGTTRVAAASGSPGATAGAALASEGDIVQRTPPVYPLTARRQGLQGTTMVRARFDAHGRPEDVAVVASSGSASLDDAAREAVRRWRFRAGAAGVLDMPIIFRLNHAHR